MPDAHLRVFRGAADEPGHFDEFDVPVEDGMVVLDALHWIQGHEAPDLAVRWNCKAAKCGSCSAEVDGRPSLTCKTRLSDFDLDEPITVEPMRAFPLFDPKRRLVELWSPTSPSAVHAAGGIP
jgi:succinate dehydrogenase / fumarate reductase iron-sulfur subunit